MTRTVTITIQRFRRVIVRTVTLRAGARDTASAAPIENRNAPQSRNTAATSVASPQRHTPATTKEKKRS